MFGLVRRSMLCLALALVGPAILTQAVKKPAPPHPTLADLTYATVGGQPLKLDLYLPRDTRKPVPLMIHIHGGGWSGGTKNGLGAYFQKLVELGFAVASVQYRLTSEAGKWGDAPVIFPAQIQDVKGAVRWLRAHAAEYHLDPARFGAWGESAGGHLTALLTLSGGNKELEGDVGGNLDQSSKVQVGIDYYGPTDLIHLNDDVTTPPGCKLDRYDPKVYEGRMLGYDQPGQGLGDIKKHWDDSAAPYPALRHKVELASPLWHVKSGAPPLFIGQGKMDVLVPYKQSVRLAEALKKAGSKVELALNPDAGHGPLGDMTDTAAIRFVCQALNPEALKNLDKIGWDFRHAVNPALVKPNLKQGAAEGPNGAKVRVR